MLTGKLDTQPFILTITWFPLELVFEVIDYAYPKCVDCKYNLTDYYECNCGRIRCKFHHYVSMDDKFCKLCVNDNSHENYAHITFKCINEMCNRRANYGYRDIVLYCHEHAQNKLVIEYDLCRKRNCLITTNMLDTITNQLYCSLHMKQDRQYEYNYLDFRNT